MRIASFAFLVALIAIFSSCSDDQGDVSSGVFTVGFRNSSQAISETKTAESVIISFDNTATIDGTIDVLITEVSAVYGENFSTQPVASGSVLQVSVYKGSSQATIAVAPIVDSDDIDNQFYLTITSTSSDHIQVGNSSITITISESETTEDDITQIGTATSCDNGTYPYGTAICRPGASTETLDIVTWNIENFPNAGSTTISKVAEIIRTVNADIYAIQEITSISDFNSLVNSVNGYDGFAVDVNYSLELGFIYKTSEISEISDASLLFSGQTSPFPREPVEIEVTHTNGITTKLINIHLKCCDGSQDRRKDASEKLEAYIDANYPNDEVIVLGDWNEDFINGYSSFSNFVNNSNYLFADYPINESASSNFSYPSWPSHLDHILLTDELCDNLAACYTLKLDNCISGYPSSVSDHRPVMVSLSQ